MRNNLRQLLIHKCDIQRPARAVSTATIRDRQVSYTTQKSNVACWFESTGANYSFNDQLGQIAVKTYTVHFLGGEDLKEGDRLKRTVSGVEEFYLVRAVIDNSDQGFHVQALVEAKTFAMA